MIRVVIADDHHLVREGIRALLEKAGDIVVVAEAEDGEGAVAGVMQARPDVLVMDISMPRLNGLQAIAAVRKAAPETEIIVLTMYSSEMLVSEALKNGARGYLLKDSLSEELLIAVRAAARGATYFSPTVADAVLNEVRSPGGSRSESGSQAELTPRELELLQLICEGLTNNDLAERMSVSVKTVERHRANVMAKLGAHNIVELIRTALKMGLVRLDD